MSNKIKIIIGVAVLLLLAFSILGVRSINTAQIHVLDLPPREQWENGHGYCGETSVQTDALYYGTYVSQYQARRIAGGEVLIGVNDGRLLRALKLKYEEWDYKNNQPQYRSYLVWVKKNIERGYPVIITVYVRGMDDPDYDHIIPVTGYRSSDIIAFHDDDQLIFNSNFEKKHFIRSFESLYDTRAMKKNGRKYEYCIPKNVDYGIAITGTADKKKETVPVSLSLGSWKEPDVSSGSMPEKIHAKITIRDLVPGRKYVLLKYTNYQDVPDSGFLNDSHNIIYSFKAKKSTEILSDSFMSNTLAIYRCVRDIK